jgi:myo-inositol 2-dehydrogenase/D-chiro-inositol 1-dehydrogenase
MASEGAPAPARVALIGAGRMGRVHLEALLAARGVELAAVVEPVAALRRQLATGRAPCYESVDELLGRGVAIDGALIATPSDQHLALVGRLAAAGVAMLCEKPVGVSACDAVAATVLAAVHGVLLQVGYWRRFVPELQALRGRIAAGELGTIAQLSCLQWDQAPPTEAFRAHSGGICIDMGVHEFDQARWLLGQELEWVCAAPAGPSSVPRPGDDPDNALVMAGMSGGAAVTVSLGRRFAQEDSCWLEIWGGQGYARVPFMWGAEGQAVFRACMVRQAEAFAVAVRGGAQHGAGGNDAVAALAAAELAAQSLRDGGRQVRRGAEAVPA